MKKKNAKQKQEEKKTFHRLVVSNGISSRENHRKKRAMITKLLFLNPGLFKKTAYITVRKDYLRKSQAELRTENSANQEF